MSSLVVTNNKYEKVFRLAISISLILHVFILINQNPGVKNIIRSSALNFESSKTQIKIRNQKEKQVKKKTRKKIAKKTPAKKKVPLPQKEKVIKKKDEALSKVLNKDFRSSILKNIPPVYPRAALKRGWSGKVKLKILVLPNGTVAEVHILEPSPFPILDKSATNAAKKWVFRTSPSGKNYLVHKTLVFEIQKS